MKLLLVFPLLFALISFGNAASDADLSLAQLMEKLTAQLKGSSPSEITSPVTSALEVLQGNLNLAVKKAESVTTAGPTTTTTVVTTTTTAVPPTTTYHLADCIDTFPLCPLWAAQHQCLGPSTFVWMTKYCHGSCSSCTPVVKDYTKPGASAPCVDLDDTCATRQTAGECLTNVAYTKYLCAKTCRNCKS